MKQFRDDILFSILLCLYASVSGYRLVDQMQIFPHGTIISQVGSNVSINCTVYLAPGQQADLVWQVPINPSAVQDYQKFIIRWRGSNTLELTVIDLDYQDAGPYLCESKQHVLDTKIVRIWVPENQTKPCSTTQFRCQTGQCIFRRFRCDHIVDCPDATDELNCEDTDCEGKFTCDNGQCIDQRLVCDSYQSKNCRDGSDEKYCGRNIDFTGQIRPAGGSTVVPYTVEEHNHGSWHFNAIYSAVAGVIGLICVVAIVIITVCRVKMRREAWGQLRGSSSSRSRSATNRPRWQQSTPYYRPPELEPYIPQPPPPYGTNLELSINLRLMPGPSELAQVVPTPPPYSEVEPLPTDDSPPPPYSTLERPPEDSERNGNRQNNKNDQPAQVDLPVEGQCTNEEERCLLIGQENSSAQVPDTA